MSDERFNKLEQKIESISEIQSEMNETLTVNTVLLEEHMKRSDHLEKLVEKVEDKVEKRTNNLYAKVAGILASLLGLGWLIHRLLDQ